jgi:hypothetical protein
MVAALPLRLGRTARAEKCQTILRGAFRPCFGSMAKLSCRIAASFTTMAALLRRRRRRRREREEEKEDDCQIRLFCIEPTDWQGEKVGHAT